MQTLYYIQTDLACVLILLLLLYNRIKVAGRTFKDTMENWLLIAAIVMSASDVASWLLNGVPGTFARVMLYLNNILYFLSSVTLLVQWLHIICLTMGVSKTSTERITLFTSIPVMLFALFLFTTPLHGLLFTVDEQNVYHRGSLVWIHWLVCGLHIIGSVIFTIIRSSRLASAESHSEALLLVIFYIFPVIALVAQAFFYGASLVPLGVTLSLVMFCTRQQNSMITKDALTDVNNRGQLDRFLHEKFQNPHSESVIFLIMIDMNGLKRINDRFGHLAGDHALQATASVLKKVGNQQKNLFIARYGGDEFVMCGIENWEMNRTEVLKALERETEQFNRSEELPFEISLSIGSAGASITNTSAVELIKQADHDMYIHKQAGRDGSKVS
ncbi:MAG: diguanylate cyclase [Lachnospiraceae bacterium]|nr:diguanylate cyclase [Lachnospiraceae bacterium]